MTEEYFHEVLRAHDVTLVAPPVGVDFDMHLYRVVSASVPTWSIDVPVWTQEEGRSDLTLQLRAEVRHGRVQLTIEGLRVL